MNAAEGFSWRQTGYRNVTVTLYGLWLEPRGANRARLHSIGLVLSRGQPVYRSASAPREFDIESAIVTLVP